MMRELNINEVNQVVGGEFFGDLQSIFQNGLTHPEKTVGIIALSLGLAMGGLLPKVIALTTSLAIFVGWNIYDLQSRLDALEGNNQ